VQKSAGAAPRLNLLGFEVDLAAYEIAAGEQEALSERCADPQLARAYRTSARTIRDDAAWMAQGGRGLAPSLCGRLRGRFPSTFIAPQGRAR
jgi:hypothetical protein